MMASLNGFLTTPSFGTLPKSGGAPVAAPKPAAPAAPRPPTNVGQLSHEFPSYSYTPPAPTYKPPAYTPPWPSYTPPRPPAYTPPRTTSTPVQTPKPAATPSAPNTPAGATGQPDLSQVANLMALLVPSSQSQSVYVQSGQQGQPLPPEADRAFRGKDPGISGGRQGNALDMLRQGFWGG